MTDEQKKYGLLNRVVLAHCYMWMNQHIKDYNVDMPTICYQIKAAGYASKVINGFSEDESKFLKELGQDKAFMKLAHKEVSLVVMALEVMKYHVTNVPQELRKPKLNISDKKLKYGKAAYAKYMLETKRTNKEMYEKQREVINDTCEHAPVWYEALKHAIMLHEFTKE